jgi:hypothetical protein
VADRVSYSGSLILSLEKSLASAFNQPYLALTKKPRKAGGGFYSRLERGDRKIQSNEGDEQEVAAILTKTGSRTPFYFAFVGTFRLYVHNDYTLQHASLIVFHDVLGEVVPLFRAEWDYLEAANPQSKHAQPHWHFVQRPNHIERIVRMLIEPVGDFRVEHDELFAGLVDCSRFHFAMTSLGPMRNQLFQSTDFSKWFQGLTAYVSEQIEYLMSKAPAPIAVEFKP